MELPVSQAERKVKGGKFLCVSVRHESNLIASLKLTGDFFIHPEDSLEKIERSVVGMPLNRPEDIAEAINAVVRSDNIKILGFSVNDLANLIGGCG